MPGKGTEAQRTGVWGAQGTGTWGVRWQSSDEKLRLGTN